jgi:hypothetical protein
MFIILIFTIISLAYVEALHYANVSVEKWNMSKYQQSHPRAYKTQKLINSNIKLQKFLIGRQFLVICFVFTIAQITTFPYIPNQLFNITNTFILTCIKIGLPGVFIVLTFGQILPQIYAEKYTIELLNLPGCYTFTRICFMVEYFGICHFAWLLFHIASYFYGDNSKTTTISNYAVVNPSSSASSSHINESEECTDESASLLQSDMPLITSESSRQYDTFHTNNTNPILISTNTNIYNDNNKNALDTVFDMFRYLCSTTLTVFAMIIVIYGIYKEYSVLQISKYLLYCILLICLFILYYLEGLMIAIVSIYQSQFLLPVVEVTYPISYNIITLFPNKNNNKSNSSDNSNNDNNDNISPSNNVTNSSNNNMQKFIIGRQFFTVLINFIIAQITIFTYWTNNNNKYNNILFYIIIHSGLVGLLITVSFAQLLPELLATKFSLQFMNSYVSYSIVQLSIIIEYLGLGHAARLLFYTIESLFQCSVTNTSI